MSHFLHVIGYKEPQLKQDTQKFHLSRSRSKSTGAPNDRFRGNDLKWLVMHPGVL